MLTLQEGVGVDLSREQAQWGLDAWHVGGPAMTLFGERNLVRQGIREFAQSQTRFHNNTGKINCVYPNGDGRRDIVDETQGCMHWVWEYYQQTGDKRLLGEVFDKFVRVADWEHSTENPRSGLMDLGNEQPYGGGYVGFPSNYGYDMKTTQRTVLSVSTYLTYRRVSQLASELGHHDVQNRFARYAEALATAIQTHLWSDEQRAYVDGLDADGSQSTMASQQANMMVLAAGLATGDRKRGAMEAVKRAGHRTSGILVKFLIQAYGDNDEDEALMDFLLNPSGHNWAYIVRHDGSMAWEDWRTPNGSATENVRGTASESFPLSVNGAVTAIQDYVLGMTVLAPQCRKIAIRPHPGDLRFARGAIPTQQGPVAIAWNHDTSSATFRLNVDIPVNVRADVYVPKGNASRATVTLDGEPRDGEVAGNYVVIRDIGSGKHEFVGSHQR
jgi:alpha-L-rhamnosidase